MSTSISAPFRLVGGGVAATSDIGDRVRDQIINVLVTGKYERSGLAEYGAGLQQILFSNIDELELTDWKIDASAEISKYVSGVQIVDIVVDETDTTTATVTVHYRTPLTAGESLSFSIPTGEILTEESPL